MHTINYFKFNIATILNFLVSLIPLSLILGNFAINLNIVIICVLSLVYFNKKLFILTDKNFQFLIHLFFVYLIVITFINYYPQFSLSAEYKTNFFKSLYFIRFLILFLTINKLIEEKLFNFKLLFISCSVLAFVVALDVFVQFYIKQNIFGFEINSSNVSSFFGKELIAGSYIQKFILFTIFSIPLLILKKNINLSFLNLFFLIFLFSIYFSENKMPLLLYIFSWIFLLILEKKFKDLILFFIALVFTLIFLPKIDLFKNINHNYKDLIRQQSDIIKYAPELFYYNKLENDLNYNYAGYLVHFNSGVQLWKKNKIFGSGLKSFRINCRVDKYQTCNTHPHNYIIEILLDVGIIGFSLIYFIFLLGVYKFLKYYFKNNNLNERIVSSIFFLIIFFEFFPFRSSGSFFSTYNSTITFLFLAIFLNVEKIKINLN